ncbi:MAG: TraB/GumN family protein [Trueperaceae bacterium]
MHEPAISEADSTAVSQNHSEAVPNAAPPAVQPTAVVESGSVRYTLLGTAHVSKSSADEVERLLAGGDFDAVAIELDRDRFAAIKDPDRWKQLDLFQIFRQGKAGAVMASLALGAFQQRLADQVGIEPGQEMRVAIAAAERLELPLLLVDRDIGLTLRRVYRNVPWWRRMILMTGLLTSIISSEEIDAKEIEKLKEGDILEATFTEFAETSRELYEPLIAERDRYMAIKLQEESAAAVEPRFSNVLVVLGAGHLKGVRGHLEGVPAQLEPGALNELQAERQELESLPPPSIWPRTLPWLIVAVILGGFVVGFSRSPELGLTLLSDWFVINGMLAGLGALIALAHPLTIVGSLIAAPFTSLNPLIGAGMVAAGLELWLRKPTVADFETLRRDVTTMRGWWRNRVARTFLVFLFVTLGSAIGTYVAGARVITRLV